MSVSNLGLAHKKHSVPLRRMLPNNVNQKASHLDVPITDPVIEKRSAAKSLPVLMSEEDLDSVKQAASKNSVFEKPNRNKQLDNGVAQVTL